MPQQKSITFTVDSVKNTISVNPEKLRNVKAGDQVMFKSTNDTVHVDFQAGQWPFTETEGTIVVPGQSNTGYYTISGTATGLENYDVATAGGAAQTTGQIDIEPARV